MARPDEHNACPVCARPVRALYFAAQQLVDLLDQDVLVVKHFPERLEQLRLSVRGLAPFIDAHHGNQDHVLSPELAGAREPRLTEEGVRCR